MTNVVHGIICVQDEAQSASFHGNVGKVIDTDIAPWPVYVNLYDIYAQQWPVELWFVEVIRAFSSSHHHFIPAIAIKPIKLLPSSLLFGSQGDQVCLLLDKINRLTLNQVEQLAKLANPIRTEAYTSVWNTWVQEATYLSMYYDSDHSATLALGEGEETSPLNHGLLTINELFHQRARLLVGDEAFIDSFGAEPILTPLWSNACHVLLQIAMGLGAEQYASANDLKLLLNGWELLR